METINDIQLLEALKLYLNDNTYDYAVMIDGPWGCGKSFFLKEKFIPELNLMNRKYIFISLYGMSSINELNKQIYLQNILGNNDVELKSKIFGFGGSLVFDLLEKKGIDVNQIRSATDFIKDKISIDEKTVLIFDDLERTKINLEELLGFINGFIEYQHLKTILICNEQELEDSLDNIELKYLIASKDTISFPNGSFNENLLRGYVYHQKLDSPNKDKSNKLISIEELNKRVKTLFNDKIKYKKIKEKVIGNTFSYSCDLEISCNSIIESLADRVSNNEFADFLEIMRDNISQFSNVLQKSNHNNLRTFQFFLSKMYQFYKMLDKVDNSYIETIFQNNILFALKESIRYKNGKNKSNNLNYIESDIADYIRGKIMMNSTFIKSMIKNHDLLISEKNADKNIIIILNWYEYNSKKINEALVFLKEYVQEIDYTYYKKLLTALARIEKEGIVESGVIDEFIGLLNSQLYLSNDVKNILYKLEHSVLESQEEIDIYKRYFRKLNCPINVDIINPIQLWLNNDMYKLSIKNQPLVFDYPYLDNDIITQILNKVNKVSDALSIWRLHSVFDYIFTDNYTIWNKSINFDKNVSLLNELSERLEQYINSNQEIDKVIKRALESLIITLVSIKDKI